MTKAERKLSKMSDDQILNLFKSSTSAYDVYKKLGYKSSNKSIWIIIEQIAEDLGFSQSDYQHKPNRYCAQCGKKLSSSQTKFCSSSCSAIYNNSRRIKKKPVKFCMNCGRPLLRHQHKYCSLKCQQELRYKNVIKRWLDGENFTTKNGLVPKFIKRYLTELHGNKCELCGWNKINPATRNVPLEVHHIDGDCYNNNIENLQLLCPNCHSITDNYKALNKNCKRHKQIAG